ncbi:hypothetical protein [Prevotella pallens]|uniref:hypothetical protein n=1 Tax=Prevotella pallens TaxID=60133 RepID=UPI0028EAF5E9|nr:hypothetical protein [Prevotella pallens]
MNKKLLNAICTPLLLLALTACTNNEEVNNVQDMPQSYTYNIDITVGNDNNSATPNSAKAISRVLDMDDNKDVVSTWAKGDKMFVYNLSDNNNSNETSYSMVSTQNEGGKTANFYGTITSRNKMKTNDKLVFFYPGDAVEDSKSVEQVNPTIIVEKDEKNTQIEYHEKSDKIKSSVLMDLEQQDGTLKTIDKKFDFNYCIASPGKVDNDGTKGTVAKMRIELKRMTTIWGMKFKDADGNDITNIKSIELYGLRSYDIFSFAQCKFEGTLDEKKFYIRVANNDNTPIKLQKGYAWISFLGEDKVTDFTITVRTPNGIYTKSASKEFLTDHDYRSTITMNKIIPHPYVEVKNVKWATGNFIHYKKDNKEYWGIAPAQWWISNYGEEPSLNNAWAGNSIQTDGLGSQHWYINNHNGQFTQTADDLDLFQWGVIDDALRFNDVYYLLGTDTHLEGKYYNGRGRLVGVDEVQNRTQATHGDIVRYYTEHGQKHYHYQYPTEAQLDALLKANTVIPAFCYTDKGNKIYGAYFSDKIIAGANQKNRFPTGRFPEKYMDVTGLVLANDGVFLPIAGRRPISGANVEMRHIARRLSGFYGQYYTSTGTGYSTLWGVFFGAAFKMNIAAPSKDQGASIRPVYVGADDNDETQPVDASKFELFHNIITPNARLY